jgi:lipoprotein NlpD
VVAVWYARKVWPALFLILLAVGCGGRQVVHVVRPGDTLYAIGRAYGVPYRDIARANRISDPARLDVGRRLLIPHARKPVDVPRPSRRRAARRPDAPPRDAPPMVWPIRGGTVTSVYGPRGGAFHDGIDIAAPSGTPVYAVAPGLVAHSSTLSGYGRVLIIRHANGYATVYAHNQRHEVKSGQKVARGQLIARVGESGRTSGPNLHFEVRRNNVAENPLLFLPATVRVGEEPGAAQGG